MRVFPTVTQDTEYKDLGDAGQNGSLNDRQDGFLDNLSYVGALGDKMVTYKTNPSSAAFTSGPTIAAVEDGWDVTFGAAQITVDAKPTLATLSATFGAEQITITG